MTDLKTLSLYELISSAPNDRLAQFEKGVLAGDLFEAMELGFETEVSTLAHRSHQMEQRALEEQVSGGTIYVGFQRLSRFTPRVAERYFQMARAQNTVYVFGFPDQPPPPGPEQVQYVLLAREDALTDEWFIVIDTPQYRASLSALDLVGFDEADDIHDRLFTGVQTESAPVTQMLAEALQGALRGAGLHSAP